MAKLPPFERVQASQFGIERLQDNLQAAKSQRRYIQHFNGRLSDRWAGVWTFPIMQKSDVPLIKAWINSLRGTLNNFLCYDPDRIRPRGSATPADFITCDSTLITCDSTLYTCDNGIGDASVNGGSQVGASLTIDGMPASQTGYFKAGDYFQLGTGYHILTADVDTNGAGQSTITFEPIMRSSPADNDKLVFDKPVMIARLETGINPVDTDMNSMTSFSFAFVEDI